MIDDALSQLHALSDPDRATEAAAYHKAPRVYLGIPVPQIDAMVADWRAALTMDQRTALASVLWDSDIHEARLAAAKLLTQARMRPDAPVWDLIRSWAPGFDAWALADHASIAGQKRLVADPARLDELEAWTTHPNMWTRRAVLVMTLPWTKQNHPTPQDLAIRDRVLGWAAGYVQDRDWFIQKAVAGWLRDLSKHDASRVAAFLAEHGPYMKAFARKEAGQYLPPDGLAD